MALSSTDAGLGVALEHPGGGSMARGSPGHFLAPPVAA